MHCLLAVSFPLVCLRLTFILQTLKPSDTFKHQPTVWQVPYHALSCWWGLTRPNSCQGAIAKVIWLCTWIRYWPDHRLMLSVSFAFIVLLHKFTDTLISNYGWSTFSAHAVGEHVVLKYYNVIVVSACTVGFLVSMRFCFGLWTAMLVSNLFQAIIWANIW